MTPSRILNLLRVVFLGLSLACLGTYLVWQRAPEWVDRVHETSVQAYMHLPLKTYLDGRNAVQAGNVEDGLELLERAARKTADVKKGDRLMPTRIKTLNMLADTHSERGQLEEALEWSTALSELDERDLPNQMRRVQLLAELGRPEEARAILETVEKVAGNASFVTAGRLAYARATGDPEVAVEVMLQALSDSLRMPADDRWVCFQSELDAGQLDSFDLVQEGREADGRIRMSAQFPADVVTNRLRLDLPPFTNALITEVAIELTRGDGQVVDLGLAQVSRVHDLEQTEMGLTCLGATDAYAYFELPERDLDVRRILVRLHALPAFDAELIGLVQDLDLAARRAEWSERYGSLAYEWLGRILAQ